jgi:uncharacterized protein GlcG (DUF336 family)
MKALMKSFITRPALISASLLASLVFSFSAIAEDKKLTIEIKRLSAESAIAVATAAMLECRKQGYQATATVVDKNGIVQAVIRDTLAPPISIPISKAKAFTAVNFSADTSAMAERQNTGVGRFEGVLMSAGGVNINIGGTIYGAVGVSGAPSGEIDEDCAKAGIEAIAEDLEMAD